MLIGLPGTPAYTPLKLPAEGVTNEYPAIAAGQDGHPWVAWLDAAGDRSTVLLAPTGDASGSPRALSQEPGQALHPRVLATTRHGLAVVWAEFRATGDWRIMAAVQADSPRPELIEISEAGRIAMHPALASDGRRLWFVWEEKSPGASFAVLARSWSRDKGLSQPVEVARLKAGDCRRPAIACSGGKVLVAYDRFDGPGTINIELVTLRDGRTERMPVTEGPGLSMAPDVAAAPDSSRVWLAWHTNIWDAGEWDIPKWFRLASLDGGRLTEPSTPPPGRNRDMTGTLQGFEFVRLVPAPGGVVHVLGRASHNFYIQTWSPAGWSPLMRLPKDGWGGRGQHLEGTLDKDGTLLVVRRDLQDNAAARISGLRAEKPVKAPLVPAFPSLIKSLRPAPRRIEFEPWGDYKYYFGDIHGHTWISDGCGDVDEYYIIRRDYYRLDFGSLTDHDYFVGNGVTPGEWEHIKAVTEHFNEPGRFATLHGQEWTTGRYPNGAGHKNIYTADAGVPLLDHRLDDCNTGAKVVARVREIGGIAIPHHIGWTGMDWENFDPQVTPVIEIVSVHGAYEHMGNRPITHRGGLRGHFVQDGLARGLKFGIIGGTDCHGLLYQHGVAWKRDPYRAGWAVVLATDITRESVLEALRARRCYATSGIWVRLLFEVNGHIMGEEFQDSGPLRIRVECDSESPIQYIEIVRNNETIHSFGGEGHASKFTFEDKEVPAGTTWYYLRVTCRDGNMAWSSPVWVNRSS
jgi:hypothetical protein